MLFIYILHILLILFILFIYLYIFICMKYIQQFQQDCDNEKSNLKKI